MPEEFDAGTRKAKNIMDSFIEALYGRSEETIPEEYDWFAPLLVIGNLNIKINL